MPAKTIYIRDEDMEVWERGKFIFGNLSPVLIEGLRKAISDSKRCSKCATDRSPDANFCFVCGSELVKGGR